MFHPNHFTLILTGTADSDYIAHQHLEEMKAKNFTFFPLRYTLPFHSFSAIGEFSKATQYQPFKDKPIREKVIVMDLTEWMGHEDEEYLEVFVKYLHDSPSFFQFSYLFLLNTDKEAEAWPMFLLLSRYLATGRMKQATFQPRSGSLTTDLCMSYPLEPSLGQQLAEILGGEPLSKPQMDIILRDLIYLTREVKGQPLSEAQVLYSKNLTATKLYLFYEKEVRLWAQSREGYSTHERRHA